MFLHEANLWHPLTPLVHSSMSAGIIKKELMTSFKTTLKILFLYHSVTKTVVIANMVGVSKLKGLADAKHQRQIQARSPL